MRRSRTARPSAVNADLARWRKASKSSNRLPVWVVVVRRASGCEPGENPDAKSAAKAGA